MQSGDISSRAQPPSPILSTPRKSNISQVSFSSPFSQETWASKVKQPPKVRIPPATSVKPVCSSPSIAKDAKSQGWNKMLPSPNLATATEAEEVVAKKKRKRKKKNKQSPNEHPENVKFANENIVIQEPPKFQVSCEIISIYLFFLSGLNDFNS
ncbi:hypothetical protein AB205_0090650 [Aquarana catesbeiana]|uniref:Uncharacterized protein n=1 Tax=Aquarana catesbeiana TaxID=8400 RepID=A0A2G9S9T8_AQUCT|nr:hypothetical protein AB205_0090650 [Aquarana catesbeiana]